jgi:PTH2 family peptidyl-tRNA hydrolase
MKTGKKCAQACHASLMSAEISRSKNLDTFRKWKKEGQRKIVLKIGSEEEIRKLYDDIQNDNIPAYLIADAGLTQLEPGTVTALGIGPDSSSNIDKHCRNLKLL